MTGRIKDYTNKALNCADLEENGILIHSDV